VLIAAARSSAERVVSQTAPASARTGVQNAAKPALRSAISVSHDDPTSARVKKPRGDHQWSPSSGRGPSP
jgi:hypothetical protein